MDRAMMRLVCCDCYAEIWHGHILTDADAGLLWAAHDACHDDSFTYTLEGLT